MNWHVLILRARLFSIPWCPLSPRSWTRTTWCWMQLLSSQLGQWEILPQLSVHLVVQSPQLQQSRRRSCIAVRHHPSALRTLARTVCSVLCHAILEPLKHASYRRHCISLTHLTITERRARVPLQLRRAARLCHCCLLHAATALHL